MMRIILSLICLLTFGYASFAQETLSLNQAIEIAMNKNTLLQKSENSIKSYKSGVKAAYGNLLPTLDASGNWNWTKADEAGGNVNFGGFVFDQPATSQQSRNYSVSAGSNITLFDGLANIAGISQSQNDLEAARLSLARLKQDVVFQTVSLYYDVINAKQLMKVKEDDVTWNQKNLETITERNKLGAVTLADVYNQQVKTGNAELALIQAKNDLETARTNLQYYLGLDVLGNYEFDDSSVNTEVETFGNEIKSQSEDLSVLVTRALETRSDYKSAQLSLESANNGITIAESGYFPRLSGNISYQLRADAIDNLNQSKYLTVSATLSFPIFSGFSVDNRVQIAEVNAENKGIELTELERDIKRNIQKTFLDLQAAEKSLNVNEENVKAAEENRRIESEKYSLGSGTLLNVLIANSDYTTARTNYINAKFAYVVLSEQLKYYLGVLDTQKYEK
ncbi:MAG TPA: TolC family protein [Ignavibacteriaceae bacterium]|nr:TolC family protein [Ignavibacteriaceae bacterium]